MTKKTSNKSITDTLPSYLMLALGIMFLSFSYFQQKDAHTQIENPTDYISDTTGAVIEYSTGYIPIDTGVCIPIPEDPREYLEYIMDEGEGGVDYIVSTPTSQPKMDSKNGSENTEEMHQYIHKNRIKFEFDSQGKEGYIMFITTKQIPQSRNIFLGVNGVTIGWLDKKVSLPTYSPNEYLYKLNNIKYYWSGDNYNYKDLSNSPIYINAVVGQAGNKVEKIIIFFK